MAAMRQVSLRARCRAGAAEEASMSSWTQRMRRTLERRAAGSYGSQPIASDDPVDATRACHGCAHSVASAPWPSGPSGERPCLFCSRNELLEFEVAHHAEHGECDELRGRDCNHPVHGVFYDGTRSAVVPIDNYITIAQLQREREGVRSHRSSQAQRNAELARVEEWRRSGADNL